MMALLGGKGGCLSLLVMFRRRLHVTARVPWPLEV